MPEFLQDSGIWEVRARKKEPLVHRPTRLAAGERYSDLLFPRSQSPPILHSDAFVWGFFLHPTIPKSLCKEHTALSLLL